MPADRPNRPPAEWTGVRWVAFDAVGTLIEPDPPAAAAYHRVAARHGSRLGQAEIAARFRRAFRRREKREAAIPPVEWARADRLVTSEEHERDRWRGIVAEVLDDVPDPGACFAELYEHFGRPAAWRCFDDVGPALHRLGEAGYRLAVASNFDDRLNRLLDGLPELRPIELRAISALVGYRKPSGRFFRALVEAAGCEPAEIVLVGDDEVNDIEGGAAAGLRVVELARKRPAGPAAITSLLELPPWAE